jgi:uncharacterized protein (DUF4415 family)
MPTASDKRALRERALKSPNASTSEEEQQIEMGIAADPDDPELDSAFFAKAKRRRRPQKSPTKRLVSLRLDPDIVDHYRSTGQGWQGRMNDILRKAAGL